MATTPNLPSTDWRLVTPAVFDTQGAARYLGVSPATLATWRCTNEVRVPFVRLGRRVAYRRIDLDAFLASHVNAAGG